MHSKQILVSRILQDQLTPNAFETIKNINIYEGLHVNSYVVGVNFWADLISFITFNGIGRKIITSKGTISCGIDAVTIIIHEYVHHLDDMDRDGEIEIINQLNFLHAFLKMSRTPELKEDAKIISNKASAFITDTFGIGPLSELIAYTADWIIRNPDLCPLYMHEVFCDILQVSAAKVRLSGTKVYN